MKAEKIPFETLENTRDLGSLITKDGRKIKSGKLIRSGHLFDITEKDKAKLEELIDTAVDFRTDAEVYEKPDPKMKGVNLVNIEVMGNKSQGISREKGFENSLVYLMTNAHYCYEFMKGMYKGFLDGSCLAGYRRFFEILLEDHKKGILFHCTAGKDRTGFAAILLEMIFGVKEEDIVEDYMYTAICSKNDIDRLTKFFIKEIGKDTPEIRQAVDYAFSPQAEYLDVLKEEIKKDYKSLDDFLLKALNLDKAKIARLRELYLE